MTHPVRPMMASLMLVSLLMTGACDKLTDTSRAAQEVTKNAFEDTKASWTDFFTYHPPLPTPLPQTRYCYQMQSDIACYDSVQAQLTSKLVGYQDGENISWVQPGGGSLGASGAPPVALRPIPPSRTHLAVVRNDTHAIVETGPITAPTVVPFTKGQISVNALPPQIKTVVK